MQVLNAKDDALYTQLVRLAGGDPAIVMQVLSQPARPSVSLTTVMHEIEALRRRQPAANGQPFADGGSTAKTAR